MSRPRSKPAKSSKSAKKARPVAVASSHRKPLLIIAAIAVVVAIAVGVLSRKEKPVLYAQEVEVFRTHGCRCVFSWAASLREQGFRVRVYERQTLSAVRARLNTPKDFNACHVGSYLGYFLEGHIAGGALAQLTRERVSGLGLATENSVNHAPQINVEADEVSNVLVVDADGRARRWYTAPRISADPPRGM